MRTILTILFLLLLLCLIGCSVIKTGKDHGATEYDQQEAILITKEWQTKGKFPFAKRYNYEAESFLPCPHFKYQFYLWDDKLNQNDTIYLYQFLKTENYLKIKKK